MAQKLIKINIKNRNCKGLYLVNEGLDIESPITKSIKLSKPFKLVLRITEHNITSKTTHLYSNKVTLLQAIDDIAAKRGETKVNTPTKVPTLGEYWNTYTEYKENTPNEDESWRPSTAKDMKSFYHAWIQPSPLNRTLMTEITRDQIENLINKVKTKRSPRTAKKAKEALAPCIRKYHKDNNIDKINPADIKLAKLDNKVETEITIQEAKSIYKALESYPIPKFRNIFLWLRTGRRLGEVLTLTTKDIDAKNGLYSIQPENSKSKNRLTFVLRKELLNSIENSSSIKLINSLKLIKKAEPNTVNLIHPNLKDNIMDGSTVRKHWHKVLTTAKIDKPLRMHDLRHIIGTTLYDHGVPLGTISKVLGHTDSSITARYTKSENPQLADKAFQFFLDILDGKATHWTEV